MATWLTIDGDDLPLVSKLEDVIGQLEGPLQVAANIAATTQSVLTTLGDLIDAVDVNAALRALIDALIQDLIANQVNVLLIKPTFLVNNQGSGGVGGFGRIIQDALTDQGDLNRPNFGPGDSSGGVVICAFAPSFAELLPLAEAFQSLFGDGWQEFIDYVNSLPGDYPPYSYIAASGVVTSLVPGGDSRRTFIDADKIAAAGTIGSQYERMRIDMITGLNAGRSAKVRIVNPLTGQFYLDPGFIYDLGVGDAYVLNYTVRSTPPDWYTKRVIDVFPPLAEAVEALARLRDQIPRVGGPLQDAVNVIGKLIDLLQRKVALIQGIIGQLQQLVAILQQIGDLANINILPIPPQNYGDVGFINEFFTASNPPPVADNAVSLGIVIYGGSGVYGTLQQILPI